jgi:hypothetical protein
MDPTGECCFEGDGAELEEGELVEGCSCCCCCGGAEVKLALFASVCAATILLSVPPPTKACTM